MLVPHGRSRAVGSVGAPTVLFVEACHRVRVNKEQSVWRSTVGVYRIDQLGALRAGGYAVKIESQWPWPCGTLPRHSRLHVCLDMGWMVHRQRHSISSDNTSRHSRLHVCLDMGWMVHRQRHSISSDNTTGDTRILTLGAALTVTWWPRARHKSQTSGGPITGLTGRSRDT